MEREIEMSPRAGAGLSIFKVPRIDDDGTDISLKEWQPRISGENEVFHSNGFLEGSLRARFTPLEPMDQDGEDDDDDDDDDDGDEHDKLIRSLEAEDDMEADGGTKSNGSTPTTPRVTSRVNTPSPPKVRALPSERAYNLDDGLRMRSSRGTTLRVSFNDEVETEVPSASPDNPDKLSIGAKKVSPLPPWESSTKIGPIVSPTPKKFVQPTLHGIKTKKGVNSTKIYNQPSSLPAPEIVENDYRNNSNLMMNNGDSGSWGRHSDSLLGSSLNSYQFPGGGGEYDSASKLISNSLVSPNQSYRQETLPFEPDSGSYLSRSHGSRKHFVEADDVDSDDENAKAGMLCGGLLADSNKMVDFVRLFSKLRRSSSPLSTKPNVSKSQMSNVHKISRTSSTPSMLSKDPHDTSFAGQNYTIGRYDSLKLLQERCSVEALGSTPSYNVHKARKIRNHEPHRHYYKTISKTLDHKLKECKQVAFMWKENHSVHEHSGTFLKAKRSDTISIYSSTSMSIITKEVDWVGLEVS